MHADMQCSVYQRLSVCQHLVQSLYRCIYNCSCHMVNWAKSCFITYLQVWAVLLLTHPWPWISTNMWLYPLVHAGEVSVGVVGIIILLIAIITAASVIVVLLAVIARRQKAKECGTFELKAAVSVDKCSMWILVYCTVFLSCMALF